MLGRSSAADARAAASNDDERCEADFYNGELLLAHGEGDPAKETLQRARAECPPGFVEREGAVAELNRLDREAAAPPTPQADGTATAAPPSLAGAAAPVLTPPAPQANATAATGGGADSTTSTISGNASPPVEIVRASGNGAANVFSLTQEVGTAVWSYIDRGPKGDELDADLLFAKAPIHGGLSLRRLASQGEPRYDLVFRFLASDRAEPPLSYLANRLGAPTVTAPGFEYVLAEDSPFLRVDDTTYRMTVPPDEIQKFLYAFTRGEELSIKLGDVRPGPLVGTPVLLRFSLGPKTAYVAHAAAEAWH